MNSARNQQRMNAIIRTRNVTNLEAALVVGRSEQTVAAYRCGYRAIPGEVMERLEAWYHGDATPAETKEPGHALGESVCAREVAS
jgi:hypothetical protein